MHQQTAFAQRPMKTAPAFVRSFGPIFRLLYHIGVRMGPNTLLTVRGRKSGQPRTTPVAVAEMDGRRWVIGAYGEVHWVRNLRAAGEATILVDGQALPVKAVELREEEAERFYREVVPPYFATLPRALRVAVRIVFLTAGASAIFNDPPAAAARYPVFELRALVA
jgi:deazaflavin-dependent oxidoreductase (nitroreductase family)